MHNQFIHMKTDFTFPRKGDYDEVPSLGYRIALVFPNHSTFGKIYVVDPWRPTYPTLTEKILNDPDISYLPLPFEMAVLRCVDTFLSAVAKASITGRRWRLYINGRHYGPVIPPGTPNKSISIPNTAGLFGISGPDEEVIQNNILYWDDMDQAFYRRYE